MATTAAFVAAAAARARREICDGLEQAGAVDGARAMPYEPTSKMQERQLVRLIDDGVVRQAGEGRYWLDRQALAAETAGRARGMKFGIALLAGVGVIVLALAVVRALLGS